VVDHHISRDLMVVWGYTAYTPFSAAPDTVSSHYPQLMAGCPSFCSFGRCKCEFEPMGLKVMLKIGWLSEMLKMV
jgi:hypothetical protein